ncbi:MULTISPECIES: hypothetical protein [Sorangium]|uniref:hypothetical protein n=1 Tax=Sorangium TaxID=39643 RepID=UPI003D9C3504
MTINIRDAKHRMSVTFPGRPITRHISPDDIECYLRAKGYRGVRSAQPGWPRDVALVWLPPAGPDCPDRYVEGPRVREHRLEQAIKDIARNEKRTPGEVLREIAVLALAAEDGG